MYNLHGFPTQNTLKALYVLEELGADYGFKLVDLAQRENRKEAFLALNPFGKVPTLDHDGHGIFESGAICRYLANVEDSPLYPEDKLQRARVDQWMDFFSCHLGRWLNTLYFENVIKPKFNLGNRDDETCAEASGFARKNLEVVNAQLSKGKYLLGDTMTIADLFAFAYVEQADQIDFGLSEYPNVRTWLDELGALPSVARAKAKTIQ